MYLRSSGSEETLLVIWQAGSLILECASCNTMTRKTEGGGRMERCERYGVKSTEEEEMENMKREVNMRGMR